MLDKPLEKRKEAVDLECLKFTREMKTQKKHHIPNANYHSTLVKPPLTKYIPPEAVIVRLTLFNQVKTVFKEVEFDLLAHETSL